MFLFRFLGRWPIHVHVFDAYLSSRCAREKSLLQCFGVIRSRYIVAWGSASTLGDEVEALLSFVNCLWQDHVLSLKTEDHILDGRQESNGIKMC